MLHHLVDILCIKLNLCFFSLFTYLQAMPKFGTRKGLCTFPQVVLKKTIWLQESTFSKSFLQNLCNIYINDVCVCRIHQGNKNSNVKSTLASKTELLPSFQMLTYPLALPCSIPSIELSGGPKLKPSLQLVKSYHIQCKSSSYFVGIPTTLFFES